MKKFIVLIILCLSCMVNSFAQTGSINNTLGTGGSFIVKDGSGNFLRVDQSTGNAIFLRNMELGNLDNSTLGVGVITKNNKRFIHNFAPNGSEFNNLFIGLEAGNFTMGGGTLSYESSYNVGVGSNSLSSNTTGYSNTAIGSRSLLSNTIGYDNTAVGYCPLYSNVNGTYNVAVGNYSLFQNTAGFYNSAAGYKALSSNATGNWCSAFGGEALISNTTGSSNSAFGYQSLYYNNGNGNSAFGYNSLLSNSNGNNNSAFGYQALYSTLNSNNCAFGYRSLFTNTIGGGNCALGNQALYSNSSGGQNSAFGYQTLFANTTGTYNSAFGYQALYSSTGDLGSQNCAFGYQALYSLTGGGGNCVFGYKAMENTTYSIRNTVIGSYAGSTITTGGDLILIGYGAEPSSGNISNEITLGNSDITSLRCAVTGITSLSDIRDKKNIKDLSLGLDFLMKVKPREFNWDRREWYESGVADGSKIQDHPTAGFIAQEFDSLQNTEHAEWLNLVLKNNPDKWEATYGNLLPVIVKAIQELKMEKDELQNKYEKLLSFNQELAEKNELLTKEINSIKTSLSEEIEVQIKSILSKNQKSEDESNKLTLGN